MAIEKRGTETRIDLHSRALRLSEQIEPLMREGDLTSLTHLLGQLRPAIDRLRVVETDFSSLPARGIRRRKTASSLVGESLPAEEPKVLLLQAEAYGLQKKEDQISKNPSGLPWQNRTDEQWKLLVTKKEALRLFYLALKDLSGSPNDLLGCISSWQLDTPFKAFWDQNPDLLIQEMAEHHSNGFKEFIYSAKTGELATSAQDIFDNPLLYAYSMATRAAIKERNKLVRQPGGIPASFNIDSRRQEILEGHDISEAKAKFSGLIELFYPDVQRHSFKKSRQSTLSAEEWEGIAGLDLTLAAGNFYWETMVIDPEWTTARFTRTALKSIQDPRVNKFDTSSLEVSTEAMSRFGAGENTEKAVLNKLSDEYVASLVNSFTDSETAVKVLNLRIDDQTSYGKIAGEVGISVHEVQKIITSFRQSLQDKSLAGDQEIPTAEIKSKKDGGSFWVDLFTNLDQHQTEFRQKSPMLKRFHALVLERFFQCQTGDKQSSIDLVWRSFQDEGQSWTRDTIRRAITAAVNQLNHRESSQNLNGQLGTGWSRHQQARLVLEVASDPNLWSTFSERRQYVLQRYFIDGEGRNITASEIARELGIHESTVGREMDKALRQIYRFRGSIASNSQLSSKPRNMLPR